MRGPLESILTNSLVRDGNRNVVGFASRFNVVDVIAEATFRTSRANYPVRLLADFARNTKADNDRNSGLLGGGRIRRAARDRNVGRRLHVRVGGARRLPVRLRLQRHARHERTPAHDQGLVYPEDRVQPRRDLII